MSKEMNKKRWLALGIAVVILAISLGTAGLRAKLEEQRMGEMSKLTSGLFPESEVPKLKEVEVMEGNKENRILVIPVEGAIADNPGNNLNPATYNHKLTLEVLKKITEDPTIKGVILRVNSPGGGVFESAEIHKAILAFKEESDIPIWTSMGNMAASGGYYVSAPTDKIFAAPETITGSIGVIMGSQNITGLLEKLGIVVDPIKSAEHKDILSSTRPMTEEERAILQTLCNNMFNQFVQVVASGRHMDEARVRELADGRIYDGRQAVENGLADEIGYFPDVVKAMGTELGIENPGVFKYDEDVAFSFGNLFGAKAKMSELSKLEALYSELNNNAPRPLYLYGGE